MICDSVLYLVSEDPGAHGVFNKPEETQRMVYCQVMSVSKTEYYRALEQDLHPQWIFKLADYHEYDGEKICVYEGVRYRVYRTYYDGSSVELTVEEATVDG